MEANFCEANPAPAKYVMKQMGLLENNLRLPLIPVSRVSQKKLKSIYVGVA